jgi:hypothetical protein
MQDYEIIRVGRDRKPFAWKIEHDDSGFAPWENDCGHGPVSDWERRDKLPGEMILNEDRGSKRFYDFAEACRMARKDKWGFLPGELQTRKVFGRWHAWIDGRYLRRGKREKRFHSVDVDINKAIGAVYANHRATMTAREYAAGAAMQDYDRLRKWCNDQWSYVGVMVAPIDRYGPDWRRAESLWGIESDSDDYHLETAIELASQMVEE